MGRGVSVSVICKLYMLPMFLRPFPLPFTCEFLDPFELTPRDHGGQILYIPVIVLFSNEYFRKFLSISMISGRYTVNDMALKIKKSRRLLE